jgi:hypothetical protein
MRNLRMRRSQAEISAFSLKQLRAPQLPFLCTKSVLFPRVAEKPRSAKLCETADERA